MATLHNHVFTLHEVQALINTRLAQVVKQLDDLRRVNEVLETWIR